MSKKAEVRQRSADAENRHEEHSRLSLTVPVVYPAHLGSVWQSSAGLTLNVSFFAMPFFEVGLEEILKHLQDYLKDPGQLVTGPKSTGNREETVKSWKEHCQREGLTLADACALKCAQWKCNYWDRVGRGVNLQGTLTLTWQYDCCNIYNVDVQSTVDVNDKEKDMGVLILKTYSIPETDPVELGICKPCTPKCLRVRLAIVVYSIPLGGIPGQRHQMALDIKLCPSKGDASSGFKDNTSYKENEGNEDGSVANPKQGKTISEPKRNEDETWGVRPVGPNPDNVSC